jgi:predicted RNA polymerase sigma factor
VTEQDSRRAIEAVARIESGRLIAGLMRLVRDVDLATKAGLRAADLGGREELD